MFSRKLGIDKIAHLIKNKRVLIRVDYNVPMKNNIVTDDTKIRQSMQTIQFALENGAKNISLISHLGYPNDEIIREEASLKPIVEPLAKLLDKEVHFLNDCVGKHVINVIITIYLESQKCRWRKDIFIRKP
jgi:phosphoglycerate kinase